MLRETDRRVSAFLLAVATWLAVAKAAEAQIIAPGGRTLWNRGLMVRSLARFDSRAGDRRFTQVHTVVWGAAPRTAVSLAVPIVVRDLAAGTTAGTGDAAIFGRYDGWRRNEPRGSTALSVEGGLRLPTGSLGSGATAAIVSLIFSRVHDPNWWLVDIQREVNFSGGEARPGHRWSYDLAYSKRLLPADRMGVPMLLGSLELNGAYRESARPGAPGPTGGRTLYLSPGLELVVTRRLVLELAAPILIDADSDGRRGAPTKSLVFGFRWIR